MTLILAAFGGLGLAFGRMGSGPKKASSGGGGTPTGNGTMDFSIATGDDTGLLALLEDI